MILGIFKLLLILAVILVIFGPGKLPNAIRDIGKSIMSFKKNSKDEEDKSDSPKTIILNPKKPKKSDD